MTACNFAFVLLIFCILLPSAGSEPGDRDGPQNPQREELFPATITDSKEKKLWRRFNITAASWREAVMSCYKDWFTMMQVGPDDDAVTAYIEHSAKKLVQAKDMVNATLTKLEKYQLQKEQQDKTNVALAFHPTVIKVAGHLQKALQKHTLHWLVPPWATELIDLRSSGTEGENSDNLLLRVYRQRLANLLADKVVSEVPTKDELDATVAAELARRDEAMQTEVNAQPATPTERPKPDGGIRKPKTKKQIEELKREREQQQQQARASRPTPTQTQPQTGRGRRDERDRGANEEPTVTPLRPTDHHLPTGERRPRTEQRQGLTERPTRRRARYQPLRVSQDSSMHLILHGLGLTDETCMAMVESVLAVTSSNLRETGLGMVAATLAGASWYQMLEETAPWETGFDVAKAKASGTTKKHPALSVLHSMPSHYGHQAIHVSIYVAIDVLKNRQKMRVWDTVREKFPDIAICIPQLTTWPTNTPSSLVQCFPGGLDRPLHGISAGKHTFEHVRIPRNEFHVIVVDVDGEWDRKGLDVHQHEARGGAPPPKTPWSRDNEVIGTCSCRVSATCECGKALLRVGGLNVRTGMTSKPPPDFDVGDL